MDKLLDIINIILKNRGKPTQKQISADTDLRTDLGFDSLDLAELTARIEAEFDVDIFEGSRRCRKVLLFRIRRGRSRAVQWGFGI